MNGDALVSRVLLLGSILPTIESGHRPMSPWGCWKELVPSWLLEDLIFKDPLSLQMVVSAISFTSWARCQTSSKASKPSGEGRILYKIMNVTGITSSFVSWECLLSYVFIGWYIHSPYCAKNWAANTELLTWMEEVIVCGNSWCSALCNLKY